MQTLIDLSNIDDLEDRRVLVRDRLASANVRPWTPAIVRLTDGHSVAGTSPELAWLIGEPLIDATGDYLPDLQFLRLVVGPGWELRTSLRDVSAIEVAGA
jgi:hypothetical protein